MSGGACAVTYGCCGALLIGLGKHSMDALLAAKAAGADPGRSHTLQTAGAAVLAGLLAIDSCERQLAGDGSLLTTGLGAATSGGMCAFCFYRVLSPVVAEAKAE